MVSKANNEPLVVVVSENGGITTLSTKLEGVNRDLKLEKSLIRTATEDYEATDADGGAVKIRVHGVEAPTSQLWGRRI